MFSSACHKGWVCHQEWLRVVNYCIAVLICITVSIFFFFALTMIMILGGRYMVVDCGGGTVDITVHEISNEVYIAFCCSNFFNWMGFFWEACLIFLFADLTFSSEWNFSGRTPQGSFQGYWWALRLNKYVFSFCLNVWKWAIAIPWLLQIWFVFKGLIFIRPLYWPFICLNVFIPKISGVDEAFETLLFAVFGKELIDEFRRRRPAGFNIVEFLSIIIIIRNCDVILIIILYPSLT